jgi:hypothetical protein
MKLYLYIGAIVAVLLVVGYVGRTIYVAGQASITNKIKDDRITLLKDGKIIDEKVLSYNDDTLCSVLGGCLQSDAK